MSAEGGGLAAALVAAQAEMPAVTPDGTNPHFRSKFVTLGKLIAKARPVLNRHGIAVVQLPSQDDQGRPALTTRLVHESGESMEATMPLLLSKSDPQGLGSALTYAKRYALAAALGISDQEDDDGNAASAPATPNDLLAKAKNCGLTHEKVGGWLRKNGVDCPDPESDAEALSALGRLDANGAQKFLSACDAFTAKKAA